MAWKRTEIRTQPLNQNRLAFQHASIGLLSNYLGSYLGR
jgi:hypothetical protein